MTTKPRAYRMPRVFLLALFLLACSSQTMRRTDHSNFLERRSSDVVRVMTWNIGRDSMFAGTESARPEQVSRVLRAVQPDIVCLQEVWSAAERAATLFDTILPDRNGRKWQYHSIVDNVILSRFNLTQKGADTLQLTQKRIPGHAMALARDASGRSLYIICGHFESGTGVVQREQQADLVAQRVYALQAGGELPLRTPIIILGDLNSNSSYPAQFVANLRAGRIGGELPPENRSPDWDGSELEDALPRHNNRGEDIWTWKNEKGKFPPSTMDRIIYTGSVAVATHSFVLDTTTMTAEELSAAGLQRDDVMARASEGVLGHLPVVVDFRLRNEKSVAPVRK